MTHQLLSSQRQWAELVVADATRAVGAQPPPGSPLALLERFDEDTGAELVHTLRVYLDSFGSVSLAASRLFLHSNTLRHRLGRISQVSGLDLDNPTQRLAVALLLALPTPEA